MENLLKQLLGEQGLLALRPLLKNDSLAGFILPRTVIGYLRLNGIGSLKLGLFNSLSKSELGYSGDIKLEGQDYKFDNVAETEVAALVSVVLNKQPLLDIKALDLAKLSKTLDLLLKSNDNIRYEAKEGKSPTAPKRGPTAPIAQVPTVSTLSRIRRRALAKTLLVSKNESKVLCKMCGKSQFEKKEFVGCTCLKGLSKSISCTIKPEGFLLKFDNANELLTIAEAIGR